VIIFDGTSEAIVPEGLRIGYAALGFAAVRKRPAASPAEEARSIRDVFAPSDSDKAYYQQRAEAEIALAQAADNEQAVRSHYLMAGYYLDLIHHERVIDEG
jgi:hypothetical protein